MATISNNSATTTNNAALSSLYKGSGTTSATTDTGAAASSDGSKVKTAADTADQFLQLLVAQMKNQDPLNPLDNAAVTSQMAQISTVEGIEKLNSTMGKFTESATATKASNSSNLIGQNVMTAGKTITWGSDTTSVQAGVDIDAAASKVVVQLLNSGGVAVDSKTFTNQDAGTISFQWTGKDSSGVAYGAGNYTMRVTAMGDSTVNATTLTTSKVTGVTQGTNAVVAQLGNGTSVNTDDIKGVFAP